MPHVGVEYVIMVPILLVQVLLIPVAASWMMDIWVTRRRETALQDIANHLGSTVGQLYFSLNRGEIGAGNTTQAPDFPLSVESIPYSIAASQKKAWNSTFIDFHLILAGTSVTANTRMTLGPNAFWQSSVFRSNSTGACIRVEKLTNGILNFWFEGGQ